MLSASVEVVEKDISTVIPSVNGVSGAIVLNCLRGRTDRPFLVTSQADFLSKCTPNERIDIGMSSGHFSALTFLEKSKSLWIQRANNRGTFGGALLRAFNDNLVSSSSGAVVYSGSNNSLTINNKLGKKIKNGSVVTFTNTGGDLPTGLTSGNKYYAIKLSDTEIKLAVNYNNSIGTTPTQIALTDNGTGTHIINVIENTRPILAVSEYITSENSFRISSIDGKDLQTGSEVIVSTVGTIPTGLTDNTNYFVIKTQDNKNTQIKLATTYLNAVNNIPVNITGAGDKNIYLLAKTNNEFNYIVNTTLNTSDSTVNVSAQLGSIIQTGDAVLLSTEGDLTSTGLTAGTYYAVKLTDTSFKIATSQANALLSTPSTVTITGAGTGNHYIEKVDGALNFETYNFGTNELGLIIAKDQGEWSRKENSGSVQWAIEDYRDKEPNTFKIKVFKTSNLSTPIEEHIVSRVQAKTDGDGRNIYVENVIKSSRYINYIDNTLIDETVFPICNNTPIGLTGGDAGDPVTDGNMVTALQSFANPENVNIKILMDGGWSTPAYAQAITQICENRGDCVGLLSIPISAEKNSDYLNAIRDYRVSTGVNSSYVAFYSSHLKILDRFNNREIYVSPDGFAGAVIAQTASNYFIWIAPAGWKRSTLNILEPLVKYDKSERDFLINIGINPTKYKPNRGTALWGNNTSLNRPSALAKLNVRLLLIEIEPANGEALEDFEFEVNNASIRSELASIVDDYMKTIKANDGVYDYYVVCDDTNNSDADIDNYKLTCYLFIKPTKTAEYIRLEVVITRTGTDFNVALQLV